MHFALPESRLKTLSLRNITRICRRQDRMSTPKMRENTAANRYSTFFSGYDHHLPGHPAPAVSK
ncbi:MAG: hypothetical protein R6V48_07985 [Fidelibacterota bacterium]